MEEEKNITPSQYFDYLKDAKNQITTEALKKSYGTFVTLAEKYKRLGQKESLKKLSFLVDTLLKEEKLIDLGITTYVYKNVIEDYITKVADKAVKSSPAKARLAANRRATVSRSTRTKSTTSLWPTPDASSMASTSSCRKARRTTTL